MIVNLRQLTYHLPTNYHASELMLTVRLATLIWTLSIVFIGLSTTSPSPTYARGGSNRVYLPFLRTPPPLLNDYLVLVAADRDGDQDIYHVRADGSERTQLTFNTTLDTDPAYAPDGSLILFRRVNAAAEDGYYVMNADGSNSRPIAELAGLDSRAAWSPTGTQIAFLNLNPTTTTYDLYRVGLDGASPVLIQANVQTFAWSYNGSHLAFTARRVSGSNTLLDFYIVPVNSTAPTLVTADIKTFGWSPTRLLLAFSARRNNNVEMFSVIPNNTPVQLTNNAVDDDFSGWVEAGSRIVITRALSALDTRRNIYILQPDGGGETRLTNTSDFKIVSGIAPRGDALVFLRVSESSNTQRLYFQRVGSEISYPVSDDICTSAGCGVASVTWSSDGQMLAYQQYERPNSGQTLNRVYGVSIGDSGTTWRLLKDNATSPLWLAGSPYLLLYALPPKGGPRIPHTLDSRSSTLFPLVGAFEDARFYDWMFAP